jgi:hypothetical protein
MLGKSTISESSTAMIKLTFERQLIYAGPGRVATKAAGVTKALTKGGCLGHRKHLLMFREKRGSGGIDSSPEERLHQNLVRMLGAENRGLRSISTQVNSHSSVLFSPIFIKKPSFYR